MANSELEAAILHPRSSSDPHSITPVLHHSILPISLHFHIPAENALARQRPVVDILCHAEQQLMAPEKMRRRFFGDQAHGLRRKLSCVWPGRRFAVPASTNRRLWDSSSRCAASRRFRNIATARRWDRPRRPGPCNKTAPCPLARWPTSVAHSGVASLARNPAALSMGIIASLNCLSSV